MIISDFIIEAENLKEANKIAQSHKRLERLKGRTRVKKLNKMVEIVIISYNISGLLVGAYIARNWRIFLKD